MFFQNWRLDGQWTVNVFFGLWGWTSGRKAATCPSTASPTQLRLFGYFFAVGRERLENPTYCFQAGGWRRRCHNLNDLQLRVATSCMVFQWRWKQSSKSCWETGWGSPAAWAWKLQESSVSQIHVELILLSWGHCLEGPPKIEGIQDLKFQVIAVIAIEIYVMPHMTGGASMHLASCQDRAHPDGLNRHFAEDDAFRKAPVLGIPIFLTHTKITHRCTWYILPIHENPSKINHSRIG